MYRQASAKQSRQAKAPSPQVPQIARPKRRQLDAALHRPNPRQRPQRSLIRRFWWVLPVTGVGLILVLVLSGALALNLMVANRMLPGVQVGDVALGGLMQAEAQQRLSQAWTTVTLRDAERTWQVQAADLGLSLDAAQTAALAYAQGRGDGGLTALFNTVLVEPVVALNTTQLTDELIALTPNFEIAPVDAGVELANGQVRATLPQMGRMLDVAATVGALQANAGAALTDGELDLVMRDVAPAVTDASPLVAQAQALLSNSLDIQVYDPVTGDSVYWSAPPTQWGNWLTAIPDNSSPIGLALDADPQLVRDFLTTQSNNLDASRSIDLEAASASVREALSAGRPQDAFVTVQHNERLHTVQAGETITSIGWNYGIPYLYIQEANGGIDSISVGQQLVLPAADTFLLYDVVPDKRIVIDLSEQRTRVYEAGQLKWDWLSSTGIDSSPTWTGIYQVISHVPNAYAGNWNLYMPDFIGVYQPVPGSSFTNGFHGFPTRGGGRLLWTNDLGRRVTYGCILLSDENVRLLYDWAEEGVVVEIKA